MAPPNTQIDLQRGQAAESVAELAKRWKWSRGKVNRFLNELETDGQIKQQKTNVTTVITVVNYDRYQIGGRQNEQPTLPQTGSRQAASDAAAGQQTWQQNGHIKETLIQIKKKKEGEEGDPPAADFFQPEVEDFVTLWNSAKGTLPTTHSACRVGPVGPTGPVADCASPLDCAEFDVECWFKPQVQSGGLDLLGRTPALRSKTACNWQDPRQ